MTERTCASNTGPTFIPVSSTTCDASITAHRWHCAAESIGSPDPTRATSEDQDRPTLLVTGTT